MTTLYQPSLTNISFVVRDIYIKKLKCNIFSTQKIFLKPMLCWHFHLIVCFFFFNYWDRKKGTKERNGNSTS